MKKLLIATFIASAFLVACNNSDPSGTSTEGTINSEIQNTPSPDGAAEMPAVDKAPAVSTPAAPTPVPSPAPSIEQTTVTAPGMNPPHGQPGHRCDIAVGAPLNSAPATPAPSPASPNVSVIPGGAVVGTPQVIQAPAPAGTATTPAPPTTTTATAPGMNPPHGQPGHDCAVPVGSPLPAKK